MSENNSFAELQKDIVRVFMKHGVSKTHEMLGHLDVVKHGILTVSSEDAIESLRSKRK